MSNKDTSKTNATSWSAAAGAGAVAGSVAYSRYGTKFVKNVLDPESSYHQKFNASQAVIANPHSYNELDPIERLTELSPEAAQGFVERYVKVGKTVDTITSNPEYLSKLDALAASPKYQASQALHYLREDPLAVKDVNFILHEGKPAAEIVLHGEPLVIDHQILSGITHAEGRRFIIPNVLPPKDFAIIEHEGIQKLNPAAIDLLAKTDWFKEIEHSAPLQKEFKAATKAVTKAFKQFTPNGWAWNEMALSEKLPIVGFAVAAAVVGYDVVNSLTKEKHADRVLAEKQQADQQPFYRF